jgi:hypothetical protein
LSGFEYFQDCTSVFEFVQVCSSVYKLYKCVRVCAAPVKRGFREEGARRLRGGRVSVVRAQRRGFARRVRGGKVWGDATGKRQDTRGKTHPEREMGNREGERVVATEIEVIVIDDD